MHSGSAPPSAGEQLVRHALDAALHWKPLQLTGANDMQAVAPPPVHRGCGVSWPFVQNASPHGAFAGWNASFGHAAELPVHVSTMSQAPAEARQMVDADASTSVGHVTDVPLHTSCGSHGPWLMRQTVLPPASTLLGQAGDEPVHVSAGSQAPWLARHTVVFGSSASAGQVALVPVQRSAGSHAPAEDRQTKLLGWKPQEPVPEHTSHAPLHAELQHTPFAQKPELHSAPPMHVWPSPFFG